MNQIDPHAHLRAAFTAGCRIQAWHLNDGAANSNDGRWDTLMPPEGREPEFGCAPHLYRVAPEDEAQALAVWNFRMPTMHMPDGVRFYIERLVSNTDPAGMVRENLLLREEVTRLSTLIAELGQEVGAVESFRGSLNSWIMAYPEQCFSEPEPEELFWLRDAKPGLLDRISASMGRHVAKCLITDFDAAFANFTSPAQTSEARDVLWTGWYHPDPEEQDDFMLYDAKDHRCDDCIRVHVIRAEDDAAMRQEAE